SRAVGPDGAKRPSSMSMPSAGGGGCGGGGVLGPDNCERGVALSSPVEDSITGDGVSRTSPLFDGPWGDNDNRSLRGSLGEARISKSSFSRSSAISPAVW